MSKKIDFSKPLSEDDKAYVAERPWLLQDAQLNGEDIIDEDFFVDDDEDADNADEGNEDGDESTEGDDESNSDDAAEDESEDGEGDEDEVAPYAEWDYQALKDEAKSRDLSASGSKEQLIKRLEEDDASAPE